MGPTRRGLPTAKIDEVVGVVKAYSSCVGEGPFTCEWFGADAEKLREAGAEVLGIVSIFTYGMKKGLERLAAANVKNVSLTNFDVIAQVAAEQKYIKPEDVARLLQFRNDPSDESWIGGTN